MRKFKISNSFKEAGKDKTDGDDWETDPDFERDMTEIDQRWGSKRTVGSINMSELIKEVHKDHELLKDKYGHESQRDHSAGFGGKFGVQKDRKDSSAFDFDHHEKLSKHTSQEINNKTIISSSKSFIEEKIATRSGEEKSTKVNKEFFEKVSQSSNTKPTPEPKFSKNIEKKINSFSSNLNEKFEKTESSDKLFKKSSDNLSKKLDNSDNMPSSIKMMSEKFENMCRDNRENFRKLTEERRKEFFNELQSQVKETRKGFDGFDTPDDGEPEVLKSFSSRVSPENTVTKRHNFKEEEIKTRLVKEGDKIVQQETVRNVSSSSSHHHSDEENGPKINDANSFKSPKNNHNHGSLKARTLYDYEAAEEDEISFDVDELITDIEKIDSGWYKGSIIKNGKTARGLFPANYVDLLNDDSKIPNKNN